MNIRRLSALALVASTLFVAAHGSAAKSVEARVDKLAAEQGGVRATLATGWGSNVLPGDKGFFTLDGAKVENSDFEIDRIDDSLSFTNTRFKANELPARTSLRAHVTPTHTCARGGKRPSFDDREVRDGAEPAEGFVFANVTSLERVHKSEIRVTIDKGAEHGVVPTSSAYALRDGEGRRTLAQTVSVHWVGAKTASFTVTAGVADELMKNVKRIAFERVACQPAK